MKSKQSQVIELEAELLRLNDMVRARRRQLANLEKCPHADCECRSVWQSVTEQNLAGQMKVIGKTVQRATPTKAKAVKRTRRSKGN